MKKKFLLFALMSILTLSAHAQLRAQRIILVKNPIVVGYIPSTINPFSLDDPADEVTIEAELTEEALVITSNSNVGFVHVVVASNEGSVFESTEFFSDDTILNISYENWPAGDYTLYIIYDNTRLEGEFEIY